MNRWLKNALAENQILVILLAIVLGLLLPQIFRPLNDYSTQLLIVVFFTSSLRLSLDEMLGYFKDWRMLIITNAFMLVILPFALALPFLPFDTNWGLALLILGAMPTGMTIALVADYFGGRVSLALLITATTSLLAPLTIPLVLKIGEGQSIDMPVFRMFWSLALTIIAPFVLAMLVKRAVPKWIKKHDNWVRQVSIASFGLLIVGIVAGTSTGALTSFNLRDIIILTASVIWLGLLIWVSYFIVPWRTAGERITIALCMMYLNNTLALFIGDRFFPNTGVMPKLIFLLLAVNVLLPFLKWEASRVTGERVHQVYKVRKVHKVPT